MLNIIIPYETIGFLQDAKIYNKYLKNSQILNGSSKSLQINVGKDINLFIDRIMNINQMSKYNILMVNHELILHNDSQSEINKLARLDMALCKTNAGKKHMEVLKKNYNFKYNMMYTKHLTEFKYLPNMKKDWNMIIHTAGEHHWKQTDAIVKCWIQHPDLPLIIITSWGQSYENILQHLTKEEIIKLKNNKYPNIKIYKQPIPLDDFIKLKNKAGCHLCPSIIEGWGHYINEGRIVSSVVITSDFAPMNELINNYTGILIPCSSVIKKRNGIDICIINSDNIYKSMQDYLSMSENKKATLGNSARKKYLRDKKFFINSMKELNKSLKKNLKSV